MNLRSAVSIARRLQDPLAELVKIDPKAVGVGQYQHDMPPAQLSAALDGVVESCVNTVGVDLNTASAPLLGPCGRRDGAPRRRTSCKYREDAGAFKTRRELLKVPKLGPKAFEQCAGFLRVPGAKNPLDATAVHPESYARGGKAAGAAAGFRAAGHRHAGGAGAARQGRQSAWATETLAAAAGRGRAYAARTSISRAAASRAGTCGTACRSPCCAPTCWT